MSAQTSVGQPVDSQTLPGVVRTFVESGLRGERLRTTPCVRRDRISCPGVPVVASFTLDSATVKGDTARVTARYTEIGSLVQRDTALRYIARDTLQRQSVDTILLARGAGGWQVIQGGTVPRVSAALAIYYFDLDEATGKQIAHDARMDWSTESRPVLTPPALLTQLPDAVRDSLVVRGCTVLQARDDLKRNVVSGAFFGTEGRDWAVLCVVRGEGKILVFPHGGAPASLTVMGPAVPDPERLPDLESSFARYGCAPSIFRVPASAMKESVTIGEITGEFRGGRLTAAERKVAVHDGLGSGDCEGVSNLYYWTGKRWVLFAGGD